MPPETFFEGVYALMPSHYLWYRDGKVETHRYWEPKFAPDESMTEEQAVSAIEKVFEESVAAHKISDVEVGSFLSSGVDSSYMAYLAHVDKTFTVGFANKQYDETDYAAEFSKFMGVKNYAYRIEPEEYCVVGLAVQRPASMAPAVEQMFHHIVDYCKQMEH